MANEPGDLALQMQFELDADETAVMELKLGQYIKGDKGDQGGDGPTGPAGSLTPEDMALINTATANAQASASQAQGSANAAAQSATTASTQATNSANSAQSAQQFANAAAASATNAAGSSAAAGQQAANAAASATAAAQSATNASNSAATSSTWAGQSQTSATASAASATQSAQSASSAAGSASGAQSSAQAAAASATAAAGSAQDAADWAASVDPASFIKKAGDSMAGPLKFPQSGPSSQTYQIQFVKYDGSTGARIAFDPAGGIQGNGLGFMDSTGTKWNFQVGDGGGSSFANTMNIKSGDLNVQAGNVNVWGAIGATGEVSSTNSNSWRIKQGGYGVFTRVDATNAYLMQTANGDPAGSWNSYRPLTWALATGAVTIDGTGAGTTFGGNIISNGTGGSSFQGDIWINNSRALYLNSSTGHAILRCDANIGNGVGGTAPAFCIVNNANTAYNAQFSDSGNYYFRGFNWGSFETVGNNGDRNGYRGFYSQGYVKLTRYDYGPYIDFARTTDQDYVWRMSYENSNDRLRFGRNGGQYVDFLSDGNIFCGNRGYVWDAINSANNNANGRVTRQTNSFIGIAWDGGAGHLNFTVDSTLVAYVQANVSDEALKTNIEPTAIDSLGRIEAAEFVAFDWKPGYMVQGHVNIGLVAQREQPRAPDWVQQPQATEGEDPPPLMLNAQAMLYDAMHAIQQLAARVATLEAQLSSLQT